MTSDYQGDLRLSWLCSQLIYICLIMLMANRQCSVVLSVQTCLDLCVLACEVLVIDATWQSVTKGEAYARFALMWAEGVEGASEEALEQWAE